MGNKLISREMNGVDTMKKTKVLMLVATLFAAGLLCLALAACSGNTPASEATDVPAVSDVTEAPAEVTEAPTAEPTEAPTPEPTEEPTPTEVPTADASIPAGTNVALTAEREVSSTTGAQHVQWGWSEEYVNDGYTEINTEENRIGWTTAVGQNFDTPEWEEYVIFELQTYTSINKVVIYPVKNAGCFPIDYQIDVSMDGIHWTTVGKVEDDERNANRDDSPSVIEFEAVTARYVCFLATELGAPTAADGYMCQICEIEVYSA